MSGSATSTEAENQLQDGGWKSWTGTVGHEKSEQLARQVMNVGCRDKVRDCRLARSIAPCRQRPAMAPGDFHDLALSCFHDAQLSERRADSPSASCSSPLAPARTVPSAWSPTSRA